MTGKEIAEICARYKTCKRCDSEARKQCDAMMEDLDDASPDEVLEILEKEYGNGE